MLSNLVWLAPPQRVCHTYSMNLKCRVMILSMSMSITMMITLVIVIVIVDDRTIADLNDVEKSEFGEKGRLQCGGPDVPFQLAEVPACTPLSRRREAAG
eukprot:166864-Rhodomonas_salina.1